MATMRDLLDTAYVQSYRPGTPNAEDCSGFVISAAEKLDISLPNLRADDLLRYMHNHWQRLGTGAAGLTAAQAAASTGRFVVVGATSKELGDTNGHVAVLLPETRGAYPLIYGGAMSETARTQGDKGLNWVFRKQHHTLLRYYSPYPSRVAPTAGERSAAALKRETKDALAAMPDALRTQLYSGISHPTYTRLSPPLRLCRFTDARHGPDEGLVSPWWIAETDFLKIIAAREHSRAVHHPAGRRALSLGFLARVAVAVPQEWQRNGASSPTTMDLLLRGDLRVPVAAFQGPGRLQRETAPNGIEILWRGWPSVTQYFIPELSREAPVRATVADVMRILAVGAPTHISSGQLYRRV